MNIQETYDWKQLQPLFWSEIASSFMINNIFEGHREITREFLNKFLGISFDRISLDRIQVTREKNYPGKGHIDVFISVADDFCVLIEVKVHDFASPRTAQLETYFKTALENRSIDRLKDVFLIYLTQYNRANDKSATENERPRSILEFQAVQEHFPNAANKMRHINWAEFHEFMASYLDSLTKDEKLILQLHRQWIEGKNVDDRDRLLNKKGKRALGYYFEDNDIDLVKRLSFGKKIGNSLWIYLKDSTEEQLNDLISTIEHLLESRSIDRIRPTKNEYAIKAVNDLIDRLRQDDKNLFLLPFYKKLFGFADSRKFLQIAGTGKDGLSIKVNLPHKGMLSLCTIWTSKHAVEFKL